MSETRHVLAARLGDELWSKLEAALRRSEFELNRVESLDSALELTGQIPFDVVLIGYADASREIDDLLAALRRPESRSRGARVLVFAAEEQHVAARALLARGAGQVLSTALEPLALQQVVLGLLRAMPRVSVRVMARLTVRLGDGLSRLLCQTRDLSRSGMLAITGNRYPIGTRLQFALDFSDQPDAVRGEAEVVRHAELGRDPDEGLGLRFLSIAADGERRLAAFLAKHGV